MLKSKIVRVLSSVILGFAALLIAPNAAQATAPIIDTPDNSTVVGNYTFSITIPELPENDSTVHVDVIDKNGDPHTGLSINIKIFHAGTYTYTINPFGSAAQVQSAFPEHSDVSNIFGRPENHLTPGVNQISAEWNIDTDTTREHERIQLSHVTFLEACPAGTTSATGGVPIGGSCTAVTQEEATQSPTCSANKHRYIKRACFLSATGLTMPKHGTFRITVDKSDRKTCRVYGTAIKGLKRGTCTVSVRIKPAKGAATIKKTVVTIN